MESLGDGAAGADSSGRGQVRLIEAGEAGHWDELMTVHHYVGFRTLVGESLKYVAEQDGSWLALLGWGTAAFKCGPRDRWIGWTQSQQWRRLRYIANNVRFLILPGPRRPNLASQVSAANRRRLSGDWEAIFGHPIVLAEIFVDPDFAGTFYRAAGWEELGRTQGYRRNGGQITWINWRGSRHNHRRLHETPLLPWPPSPRAVRRDGPSS